MRPSHSLRKWQLPFPLHNMKPLRKVNEKNNFPEKNLCMFVGSYKHTFMCAY